MRVVSVQIFTNGRDKFESLFSDLASARKYILLQYYIIEGDETGSRLADLLTEPVAAVFPSKGEFRKMVQGGGVSINKESSRSQCDGNG